MAYPVNSVTDYYSPKKGQPTDLPELQNYQPHQSFKVMLIVILNRLKPKIKVIIAEEQAGFRARRSTIEQIFSLKISALKSVCKVCPTSAESVPCLH